MLSLPLTGFSAPARDVDWPRYNNDYQGRRYSPLAQINTTNVTRLKPVCQVKMGEEGPFQAGPVVVGRTMFLTTAHTTLAMDAATCAVRWRHVDSNGVQEGLNVNRGVAYLDGRLFRGMAGARLAAFDAATGKVLWDQVVGDPRVNEAIDSAPVAWNGRVMVGVAGGDYLIRGRMMGFDAATGRRLWTFNTIPEDGEVGADTWPKDKPRGGGGLWTTYTLDPKAGELFISVANPAPDLRPDLRPGDNLFSDSMVVLDATTGKLKWWRQVRHLDAYDWDLGAAPAIYQTRGHDMAVVGSKDGYLYGIDRASHQIRFKTAITTIKDPGHGPPPEGVYACPGVVGGVEWNGPAVDPQGQVYVGAVDWCATYHSGDTPEIVGDANMGTGYVGDPNEKATGWITAIDGATGKIAWRFHAPKPVVSGLTPTAGGLLFAGDMAGNFYAFDRKTGRVLLKRDVGGPVAGGVATYTVGGRQYVATTAGNLSHTLWGTAGSPTVIVMALDAAPPAKPQALAPVDAFGPVTAGAPSGQRIFGQFCALCHGPKGEGAGGGPNLAASSRRDHDTLTAFIKHPTGNMMKLFPQYMDEAQVSAAADYVLTLQRQAAGTK